MKNITKVLAFTIVFSLCIQSGSVGLSYPPDFRDVSILTDDPSIYWYSLEVVTTDEPTGDEQNEREAIVSVGSNGNIYIVWVGSYDYAGAGGDDYDIFYKFYNKTSNTWNATELVSVGSDDHSHFPFVAVDSIGNVHITWNELIPPSYNDEYDLTYKKWNITTGEWSTAEVISVDANDDTFGSIAADSSNNIHIVWDDGSSMAGSGSDRDVFYKRWFSENASWSDVQVVSSESSSHSSTGCLSVDSADNVHVVWTDITDYSGSGADSDIFYKYLNETTHTWSTTEVVSFDSTYSSHIPSLAVDSSGNVHTTWFDVDYQGLDTDNRTFHYSMRDKETVSWSTNITISDDVRYDSQSPGFGSYYSYNVAVDQYNDVHLVWDDLRDYDGAGTDEDIFYKRWFSANSSWSSIIVLSSYDTTELTINPCISASGEHVAMVWLDDYTHPNSGSFDWDVVCQRTTYLSTPSSPVLAALPTTSSTGNISLSWNEVDDAQHYYVYRSETYIDSVVGLAPIATVSETSCEDLFLSNGTHYYGIVAANIYFNSSVSNIETIQVEIILVPEFSMVSITLMSISSALLVFIYINKRKRKNG